MGAHIIVSSKSTSGKTLAEILAAGCVVLYGHYSQESMPEDLRRALNHRQRWKDAGYLARIIFQDFVDGNVGFTDYAIDTELDDNDVPIMVVDVPRQMVLQFNSWNPGSTATGGWTFEAYVNRDEASYGTFGQAVTIETGPAAPAKDSAPR